MIAEEIDKDDLLALAQDAEDARLYSSPPDGVVMRAIGLGLGTRAELRRATGFGYDVIEKCLERNSAAISFQTIGEIERFKIRGKEELAPEKPSPKCIDCSAPVSANGNRCIPCSERHVARKRIDGMAESIRKSLGHIDPDSETESDPALCGCGRDRNHGGRCFYRRKHAPSLHDELLAEKRNGGGKAPPEEKEMAYVQPRESEKNITETITERPPCGCGRAWNHKGRCAARRAAAGGDFPASRASKNGHNPVKIRAKAKRKTAQSKAAHAVKRDKVQDKSSLQITLEELCAERDELNQIIDLLEKRVAA